MAPLFIVISAGTASADSYPPLQWSAPIKAGTIATSTLTSPNGQVTVGCDLVRNQDLVTYSSTGALVRQISRTAMIDGVNNCISDVAVGKTGTVYGIPYGKTASGSWARGANLLAYDGNTLKWKYPLECGYDEGPQYTVGADGNIYATVHGDGGLHLIGLTPNVVPPLTQPAKVLDIQVDNNTDCSTLLHPYKDGIVLHGQNGGGARYYSYSGKYLGSTPGDVLDEKINANGQNFTPWYIQGTNQSSTIKSFDPRTKATWTTITSTPGADVQWHYVYPLAGGNVLDRIHEQKMSNGVPATPLEYIDTLVLLNSSGQKLWTRYLPSTDTGTPTGNLYGNTYIVPDGSGKFTIVRELRRKTSVSSPKTVQELVISTISSANVATAIGTIKGVNTSTQQSGYLLDGATRDPLVTSADTLFLNANCTGSCTTTTSAIRLYPIKVTGLGMDYPRGDVINRSPRPTAAYIALGDSFSSGEGVPPFEAGTDIAGVNTCHRSTVAYPRLIAGSSANIPSLGTSGFRACSGAVTVNVTDLEQWNESIQLDWWPDTTRLVTMTIGGNDVEFAPFARACVLSTCAVGSTAYNATLDKINNELPGKLEATYERILKYAPNAKIYVLGYPQVVANKLATDPGDQRCIYLQDGGSMWADAQATRDIVTKLDAKISAAITTVQNIQPDYQRLHYVDLNASGSPFVGREVCGTAPSSWFNNVDQAGNDYAYVFHPNADGQEGYATIVGAEINAG